jgi:hypothetical protein
MGRRDEGLCCLSGLAVRYGPCGPPINPADQVTSCALGFVPVSSLAGPLSAPSSVLSRKIQRRAQPSFGDNALALAAGGTDVAGEDRTGLRA